MLEEKVQDQGIKFILFFLWFFVYLLLVFSLLVFFIIFYTEFIMNILFITFIYAYYCCLDICDIILIKFNVVYLIFLLLLNYKFQFCKK